MAFGLIYRPPSSNCSDELKLLDTTLNTVRGNTMSGITLLGDVNIDMLKKLHEDTVSLNDILWDHGQLVQQEYHLIVALALT